MAKSKGYTGIKYENHGVGFQNYYYKNGKLVSENTYYATGDHNVASHERFKGEELIRKQIKNKTFTGNFKGKYYHNGKKYDSYNAYLKSIKKVKRSGSGNGSGSGGGRSGGGRTVSSSGSRSGSGSKGGGSSSTPKKKISNPYQIPYEKTNAHGILNYVKTEYYKIFDATGHIDNTEEFGKLDDAINNLRTSIKDLNSLADENVTAITLDALKVVPEYVEDILDKLSPSGSTDVSDVEKDLVSAAAKITSSYYKKECEDIDYFVKEAASAKELCDTKITSNNKAKVKEIKGAIDKIISKANKRRSYASSLYSTCYSATTYDVIQGIYSGSNATAADHERYVTTSVTEVSNLRV